MIKPLGFDSQSELLEPSPHVKEYISQRSVDTRGFSLGTSVLRLTGWDGLYGKNQYQPTILGNIE